MQHGTETYNAVAKITRTPRQLEASLLLKAATQLQTLKDSGAPSRDDLIAALYYNRRLWSIFVGSVTTAENELPREIKNNIASLGAFIFRHTLAAQQNPTPETLDPLININREVAAGLHDEAPAADSA